MAPPRIYNSAKEQRQTSYRRGKYKSRDFLTKSAQRLRTKRLEYKTLALAHYGSKCARCGFSDPRALQFDHVKDDGYLQPRKQNGERQHVGCHVAEKLVRGQWNWETFQVLCANCNWIKRAEYEQARRDASLPLYKEVID